MSDRWLDNPVFYLFKYAFALVLCAALIVFLAVMTVAGGVWRFVK